MRISLYVREWWRQTEMEGKEAGGSARSVVWEKEQFIISAQHECINCLGCWKFTFYTTPVAV